MKDPIARERIKAVKQAAELAYATAKEAVAKADAAMEKRLDGMNEFRKTVGDQAERSPTRAEVDAQFAAKGAIGETVWRVALAVVGLLIAASGFVLALTRAT